MRFPTTGLGRALHPRCPEGRRPRRRGKYSLRRHAARAADDGLLVDHRDGSGGRATAAGSSRWEEEHGQIPARFNPARTSHPPLLRRLKTIKLLTGAEAREYMFRV